MTNPRRAPLVGLIVVLSVALGACAAGAASRAPESGGSGQTTAPPTDAPIDDGDGTVVSPPDDGDPGNGDDGGGGLPAQPGQPQLVVPQPGQLMIHSVAIAELLARVEGRNVTLNARWWSGVEPCSVLDSVTVDRDGTTFTINLHEGTSDLDAVCIAIAVEKVTVIDLGELEPGTYTLVAGVGDAAAVTVEVS